MKKLEGKVALITGSSRGIGRATALLFASEGCKIIVNYHNSQSAAQKVVDKIQESGGEAYAIQCDVTNTAQLDSMKNKILENDQTIDILVNNAGTYSISRFNEVQDHCVKEYFEINYFSVFSVIKKFHSLIKSGGKIINISSISGIVTSNSNPAYGNAKAAIIHLTKTLALELAPSIMVNTVAPGWVDTDMAKNINQTFRDSEIKNIPLQRFSKPEEIAHGVLFLASSDSNYITGHTLVIDGGYSVK